MASVRGHSGLTSGPEPQLFAIDFDIVASIDGEGSVKKYPFDGRSQWITGGNFQQFSTKFFG